MMQQTNDTPTAYKAGRKEKIIRLATALVLPLIFYLVCYFMKVGSILWILPMTFILALLFTVPCFINVGKIKNGNYESVKPFILTDLLYYLLPAVGMSFASALFLYLFFDEFKFIFILTIILVSLFILIDAYFWLSYYVNNTIGRRMKKR